MDNPWRSFDQAYGLVCALDRRGYGNSGFRGLVRIELERSFWYGWQKKKMKCSKSKKRFSQVV